MRRAAIALWLAALPPAAPAERPAELVGLYDGGQMEMAAGLELRADGRFRFGLSYGALDELAEGEWTVEQGAVYLSSVPKVKPPRFVLESDEPAPSGTLNVRLADPEIFEGMPLTLIVGFAGEERPRYIEAEEDGTVPLPPGAAVVSVVPDLPVYEIPYQPHALDPARGHALVFRFEVNDLGKADFQREPLRIEDGALLLDRHGRTIRFRKD